MPTTTAVCPRCLAEVSPDMTRCRACNQTLARPTVVASIPSKFESDTTTGALDRGTPSPPNSDKVRVSCACGAAIRVSIALRGKRVKCPKCSAVILVPISQDSSASSGSHSTPVIERRSVVATSHPPSSPSADSSVENPSAESAVIRPTSDEQGLRQEIEAAAKLPIPNDAVPSPSGRISSSKLRKLRKQLETANVLKDKDNVARRQSLIELGESQDPDVLEILNEHAQDTFAIIREGALTALGKLGDPSSVGTVLRALLDRDSDVIRAAFAALKLIGDRRVVRPLLRYGQERPQWKPLANDTLVRIGPRVMQELLGLSQSDDTGLVLDAIVVLGRIGDKQAVPSLIERLSHVSHLIRANVAEALALIGEPSSVPHLIHLLKDPHATVRANSASGLVRQADPRSLRPLLNALQDEDAEVRRYAAIALGELGNAKAIPDLLKVLQGWDLLVAMDAPFVEAIVETVGKLGDASAAMGLLPLLQSKHEGMMFKTVLALKKLRSPSAIPALTSLLHSPQATLRRRVVETLGHSGDASLVPVLGEVLRQDASREVRATAARSLGELKSHDACPFLEEALREEFSIRCQAVIALGLIRERSTLAALMAMLKDGAPEVRYHAINAIAKFKDPKTLKALAVMLEDSDPMVRSGASKVIDELDEAIEDKAVKEIVRRARTRDLLGKLIPKWVYFVLPQSKAARSVVAGVLAASLLLGFIIKTTIGGPNKILVRGNVQSLTLSPDGGTLVAERTLGMLEVWDVNGQRVSQQIGLENLRMPLFRAKDGIVLLSNESVVPWKLTGTPDLAAGWKEHKQPIQTACVTPDAKFAATMGRDLIAVVWDLETGQKRGSVELDERFAATLTISPDGQSLATSNRKGEVALWEIESGRRTKELPANKVPKPLGALALSPDGNWLAAVEVNGGLRVWDLSESPTEKIHESRTPLHAAALRFLSDSKRVVMANTGGDVRVWDIDSGESRTVCSGELDQIDGFALSADEKRFMIGGSSNSMVLVYDLESGDLVKKLDVRK